MTTGNRVVDSRIFASATFFDCHQLPFSPFGKEGHYWSKVWNGGDAPKQGVLSPRSYKVYSYNIYNSSGKVIGRSKRRLYTPEKKLGPIKQKTWNDYRTTITTRDDTSGSFYYYCGIGSGDDTNKYKSTLVWTDQKPNYYRSVASTLWNNEDTSALYGKLAARMGSGFNLATFLGEGRESLKTITESSTRIYKAIKAAKKGNFPKAWNALRGARNDPLPSYVRVNPGKNRKNLADNWLQLQYGWKPLLNDIFDACKHLAYTQNRDFSATYRLKHEKSMTGPIFGGVGNSQVFFGDAFSARRWICKVTSVNQAAILGLSDPRATAWELVPFSFVVDWFIPIGNYLEEINQRSALKGEFLLSYIERGTTRGLLLKKTGPTADYGQNYWNVTDVLAGRVKTGSLPKPEFPRIKPLSETLTFKRALNAVALILQQNYR